jgi:transposase, IS5 family
VRNGFAFLHRISWDPYNEAEDLIPQAKKYKQEYGCYPERICADRIYINTKNRNFCTRNDIRLSGKRLGRPPKNSEMSAAHKQQLSADQRRRNEVEGYFGSGKRKYSLDLIMARLSKGAENSISMAFVVMCAEKIRWLLRLFFVTILPVFGPGHGQVFSGLCSGIFGCLKHTNLWPLDKRAFELPTPCYLVQSDPSCVSLFKRP